MKIAIFGAGPCGLYIAYALGKQHEVHLYERETHILGCWNTQRIKNKFTEHAPRVWFDNYKNSIAFFKEIGIDFDSDFFHVQSNLGNFLTSSIRQFNILDLMILIILYLFPSPFYSDRPLHSIMNLFSRSAQVQLDEYSYLWEGIDPKAFSVKAFIATWDTFLLYNMYLPKKESDIYYEPKIKKALSDRNVTIYTNHAVTKIKDRKVYVKDNVIEADAYIMCIPPKPFMDILEKSDADAQNNWANYELLMSKSKKHYYTAIGIQFHFKKRLFYKDYKHIPHIFSSYKIAWSMSKYYISTCVLNLEKANKHTKEELIQIVWKELSKFIKQQITYDSATITPSVKRVNKTWTSSQGAYCHSVDSSFFCDHTGHQNNLHYVGSHNPSKNNISPVTTHESAIVSAKAFLNESNYIKEPLQIYKPFKIQLLLQIIIVYIIYKLKQG